MKISKRDKYLRSKYGITEEQYNQLLKKQGGGCAICGKTREKNGNHLAVEHCHKPPYQIRGICCSYCNHRLIGRHNNPDLLRRIADYLETVTGWFSPPKKRPKKRRRKKKK